MSRVPVYLTLLPVWSSHGLTIARKAFCSSPPHVPMTVTDLPLVLELPHAANTSAAAPAIANARRQPVRSSIEFSPFIDRSAYPPVLLLHPVETMTLTDWDRRAAYSA